MNIDILKNCEAKVFSANASRNCIENSADDIHSVVLSKNKITSVGLQPTPAEMQTALDNGDAVLISCTGNFNEPSNDTSLSAEESLNRVSKILSETNSITIKLRHVNNSTLYAFAQNNANIEFMYLYIVLHNGRLYGNGFFVDAYINSFATAFKMQGSITKTFSWERNLAKFDNIFSEINEGYKELTNLSNAGDYTITNETGTSGDSFVAKSFANITGWDRIVYPILYAKVTATDVVSFYGSETDRSGSTNALATIDTSTSNEVVEANNSGFGGFVDFAILVALELNNTFKVNYSGDYFN